MFRAFRFVLDELEQTADIGVCHLSRQANLSLEAFDRVGHSNYFWPDRLYSYALAQFEIFCLIDLTHPACRDEADDLKSVCENLPRLKAWQLLLCFPERVVRLAPVFQETLDLSAHTFVGTALLEKRRSICR